MKNEVPRIFSKIIASNAVFHADSESELGLVRISFQTWDIQHRTCKNDRFRVLPVFYAHFHLEIGQTSSKRRLISDLIPAHLVSDRIITSRPSSCRFDRDYWLIANSKEIHSARYLQQRNTVINHVKCYMLFIRRIILFSLKWTGVVWNYICEDKWVRNTALQISSFLFCRTIRRSCGLILPNDSLKQFDHKKQSKLQCSLFEVHITLGSRSEVSAFINYLLEHGFAWWQRSVHCLSFFLQQQWLRAQFLLQLQLGTHVSGLLETTGSVTFTPLVFVDLLDTVEPAFALESPLEWVGWDSFSCFKEPDAVDFAPWSYDKNVRR